MPENQLDDWNISMICRGGSRINYLLSSNISTIFPLPSRNLPTSSTKHPKTRHLSFKRIIQGSFCSSSWCPYTLLYRSWCSWNKLLSSCGNTDPHSRAVSWSSADELGRVVFLVVGLRSSLLVNQPIFATTAVPKNQRNLPYKYISK